MSKSYEVFNRKTGQSLCFYSGIDPQSAILACCNEAGYSTVAAAEETMGRASDLHASRIVVVPANPDEDDCLQAAADGYAKAHGLQGWDLSPRWEHGPKDSLRETVVLTIPD